MDRVILHCDLNNFYASVETILHPEYKGKPIAVCGDPKKRHGIVLAKSQPAKIMGVKTGEVDRVEVDKIKDILNIDIVEVNRDRVVVISGCLSIDSNGLGVAGDIEIVNGEMLFGIGELV